MSKNFLRLKSCDQIQQSSEAKGAQLHRAIGPVELVMLGIGAIIGAGIFVITGTAAAGDIDAAGHIIRYPAGPAITLSFILTAIGCLCCALCYAELAAMIPISGSAYTYAYVSMGEIFAWLIGWDLLLEYTFDAATISVGWSGYMNELLKNIFHIHLPEYLQTPTFHALLNPSAHSQYPHLLGMPLAVNLPAVFIIALMGSLLIRGVRESTRFNNIIVAMKLVVVLVFVVVGAFYIKPSNWSPFMPYGIKGVLSGAALIFFAYIGFDALSTTAEEVRNPSRDLPLGILGSLAVCTLLYVVVAGILTGMVPYSILNTPEPVATALHHVGLDFLGTYIVSVGAVIALTSALLMMILGQPRIIFAMARDGFLPKILAWVHPRYRTPFWPTIISTLFIMLLAGMCDLSHVASLCNAGTLTAFIMVALGVIILRRQQPGRPRKFRMPWVPFLPIVGIAVCALLILSLPNAALWGFLIWNTIGMVIYLSYGRHHTHYDNPAPIKENNASGQP
ncbi:MAG: amino acid permease [Verrucomicrobiae bacterium]|nr:amino acid permease [Verrucomicrobiae bacterium]